MHLEVRGELFHNDLPCYEALNEDISRLEVLELDVLLPLLILAARPPTAAALDPEFNELVTLIGRRDDVPELPPKE